MLAAVNVFVRRMRYLADIDHRQQREYERLHKRHENSKQRQQAAALRTACTGGYKIGDLPKIFSSANMFAKSRTPSVNGRIILLMISIEKIKASYDQHHHQRQSRPSEMLNMV